MLQRNISNNSLSTNYRRQVKKNAVDKKQVKNLADNSSTSKEIKSYHFETLSDRKCNFFYNVRFFNPTHAAVMWNVFVSNPVCLK